jgi:phosphatidate cytidylyltransferase
MTASSPAQQTLGLFAGVGAMLLVASVVGFVLKRVVARGRPHGVIDNLNVRIRAWWAIVLVVGGAFALGRAGVTLLFLFVSFVALFEFVPRDGTAGAAPLALAAGFFVVLPAQYLLVWSGGYALYTIFIPVYAFLFLPLVGLATGDPRRFLERTATLQWGLMLCVFCLSHVPALLTLDIPGYGGRELLLIAFFVLVVQSSDVLQYVWGTLFGRRPVAPRISPAKTWEGLVGGVASATALGAALYRITPFSPVEAALMALVANVLGFAGGLVLSAIKRDRGIKDWSRLIDGHGGMLDRIDSLVFAAPAFFHLTRFGWT